MNEFYKLVKLSFADVDCIRIWKTPKIPKTSEDRATLKHLFEHQTLNYHVFPCSCSISIISVFPQA